MGGEPNLDWPDFQALGLPCHPSFGYGPIYRGRPGQAAIIVLADRDSHDDLLTARAVTGDDGQRLQGFLRAAGLTEKYLILRVLPVNTRGASSATLRAAVDHASTRALYQEALNRCQTAQVLVAIGTLSQRLAPNVNIRNLPVVQMNKWSQRGAAADWARAHKELIAHNYRKDVAPSASFDGKRSQVARIDLPYATLRWKGSSDDRVVQPRRGSKPSPDYFKIMVPGWVNSLQPKPLTAAEQQAVDLAP
jgi:hypothetical protein